MSLVKTAVNVGAPLIAGICWLCELPSNSQKGSAGELVVT